MLTSRLNTTRVLLSGEVPLRRWLDKAVLLAAGRPEELVFRRALEVVSVDGEATLLDVPPSASEYARTGGEQQWQVRA